ncbi:Chromatin assembly factor 1 subunit B [Zancudomyces culisetae]|uniref:Chromatin assembly factor 1 subunit B n=1 Tax=Zancudomyces culisetae TaxID=1213189 RepID=A0A1R1PH34_ZANCU|nr:Chromatin assembly factor 1 subunit B [Zancudomyces culisetae]|eukprot:OMH80247.1 Chromatin assembly factor 1 subunit B [Zancudomyces culisetae]
MVKVGTLNKFESCESNSNQKSTDVQQSASGPSDESSLLINTNDREAKGDIGTNGTGCPNKSKPDGPTCNSTSFKLFHDDNLNSFFRRLSFSPDGSMLYVPTGVYKEKITNADGRTIKVPPTETVYCWSREALLGNPDFHFPGHKKPTVATSVCPVKFKIDDRGDGNGDDNDNENEYGDTSKYFSIVAVASQNAVVIYGLDTPSTEYIQNSSDQPLPPVKKSSAIAYLGGLHYGTLTDLSWSPNGQCLILVSTDGFATVVTFDLNELGTPTPYALASPVKNTALPKSVSEISEDSVVSLQIHESLSDDEFVVVDDDIMAEKYCTEEKAQTVDLPDTDADTAALLKVSTGTETHSVSPMAIPIKTSKSKEPAANLEGRAPSKKKRRIAPTLVSTHF